MSIRSAYTYQHFRAVRLHSAHMLMDNPNKTIHLYALVGVSRQIRLLSSNC